MTESDERQQPPARRRWFQFDLRLLFLAIAAIGVILAIEVARNRKPQRKLLETLLIGDAVGIYDPTDAGITIYVNRPQSVPTHWRGTITEIGEDFIAVRRADNCDILVPATRIRSIQRFAPETAPISKPPPKAPPGLNVPQKTYGPQKTDVPQKTNVPPKTALPQKTDGLQKTSTDDR